MSNDHELDSAAEECGFASSQIADRDEAPTVVHVRSRLSFFDRARNRFEADFVGSGVESDIQATGATSPPLDERRTAGASPFGEIIRELRWLLEDYEWKSAIVEGGLCVNDAEREMAKKKRSRGERACRAAIEALESVCGAS